MMDIGPVGILIAVVCAVGSFALGRWLSRGWRSRKALRDRAAALASESRQVRRSRQRKNSR